MLKSSIFSGLPIYSGADALVRFGPQVRLGFATETEADEGAGCGPGGPPHIGTTRRPRFPTPPWPAAA